MLFHSSSPPAISRSRENAPQIRNSSTSVTNAIIHQKWGCIGLGQLLTGNTSDITSTLIFAVANCNVGTETETVASAGIGPAGEGRSVAVIGDPALEQRGCAGSSGRDRNRGLRGGAGHPHSERTPPHTPLTLSQIIRLAEAEVARVNMAVFWVEVLSPRVVVGE